MSHEVQPLDHDRAASEDTDRLRKLTHLVYALQALSFLWGVTAVVGIVINYIKREDVQGTLYQNHFDWQIRTFWWGMLWTAIGFALSFVLIGLPILFAVWVWTIYRVVKGWLKLNDGKPVQPSPIL
ncbi:DUF4870 family protein [Sphaerotilus sp.]|jgi:uncharacterized membrane protein|uniref:DUF4870 family protein n=1 Tax=Sphaerotilus sp. TaxID=2093942 RepID=UPI0034E1CBE0